MDPKVPISNPLPKRETWKEDEKNDEKRKTAGIAKANKTNLSLGITNFPSPSLDTNQKNSERVTPTDNRNPLLASSVTGVKGIKKNRDANKVNIRVTNDNLLKNSTFFDSIFYIIINE
jgi:hypothetical protein